MNAGTPSPLSMQEMMLEAGYSPSTARSRHVEIIGAVRQEPEVQSHLERLRSLRSKILGQIEKKVESADFRSLVMCFAVLEKSLHLLEGKATVRVEYVLSDTEQEELNELLRANE